MKVECLQNMFNNIISNIAAKWQKADYVNGNWITILTLGVSDHNGKPICNG